MNLNEAILKVIRTQYKKDMGEALTIVEKAGYKVYKHAGDFYVRNEQTGKEVCLRERYRGGLKIVGNDCEKCHFDYDGVCRMDFVNYLNKPFNTDWYDVQARKTDWRTPTYYKWQRLCHARNNVKYVEEDIAEITQKIAQLQETLDRCIQEKPRREQALVDVRKELGLL